MSVTIPAKLSSKSQVTIPQAVREVLGIGPHDQVFFEIQGKNVVLTNKKLSIDELFGILSHKKNVVFDRAIVREERAAYHVKKLRKPRQKK